MKIRKITSILFAFVLVLSLAACGSANNTSGTNDASLKEVQTAAQTTEEFGILPAVAGENGRDYLNLFSVILDEKYDSYWIEYAAAAVGEENAQQSVELLKSSISADIYGEEAVRAYKDPGSMRFNCFFIHGAHNIFFKGDQITITLDDGTSHTYTYNYLGKYTVGEGETMVYNGQEMSVAFDCDVYQAKESAAGEFSYFFMRDDTMETTYHLEFRYGSNLADLQKYFEGPYAYWLSAGIAADASDEDIRNVIKLFVTENLSAE